MPAVRVASGSLPSGPLPDSGARLVVLTRVGCHLCETAEREARVIAASDRVSVEIVDLDRCDPVVRSAWTDHVPVTIVDGAVVSIWALDPGRVRGALARTPHHTPSSSQLWSAGDGSPTDMEGRDR